MNPQVVRNPLAALYSGGIGVIPQSRDPAPRTATVPVERLVLDASPRQSGPDEAHLERLAQVEGPLPPLLVERGTMRVIDGMHRLLAARRQGRETIEVEFFDGSPADAFLRAVEENVRHGLPLSLADRRAAAERIVRSHPHMSDRAIAQAAGLGAKAVAAIRRRSNGAALLAARVGRDGKVRPLNSEEGRLKAARLWSERPDATVREIARASGVSPATAGDVRRRLQRGEAPVPRPSARLRAVPEPIRMDPAPVFKRLLKDPTLCQREEGRRLVRLLQLCAMGAQEWADLIAAVPPHCSDLVRQLAAQYAQLWSGFAQEMDELGRV